MRVRADEHFYSNESACSKVYTVFVKCLQTISFNPLKIACKLKYYLQIKILGGIYKHEKVLVCLWKGRLSHFFEEIQTKIANNICIIFTSIWYHRLNFLLDGSNAFKVIEFF